MAYGFERGMCGLIVLTFEVRKVFLKLYFTNVSVICAEKTRCSSIAKQYKVPYRCSKAFYKVKGLWHAPRETPAGVTGCNLAYGTRMYMI